MRKIKPKSYGSELGPIREKSDKIYPRIHIDLEHIPEAKKWKVGDTYHIEMELKMTGLSISRFQNDAEFEIREIGTEADEKEEKEEDEE